MKPKNMNVVVDGERYRTDTSNILASDEKAGVFLYRALNSNYFVQRHGKKDMLEVMPMKAAEALYNKLPKKHQTLVASFPKLHGGVGMDTATSYDE
jgi:hypothetical protein